MGRAILFTANPMQPEAIMNFSDDFPPSVPCPKPRAAARTVLVDIVDGKTRHRSCGGVEGWHSASASVWRSGRGGGSCLHPEQRGGVPIPPTTANWISRTLPTS